MVLGSQDRSKYRNRDIHFSERERSPKCKWHLSLKAICEALERIIMRQRQLQDFPSEYIYFFKFPGVEKNPKIGTIINGVWIFWPVALEKAISALQIICVHAGSKHGTWCRPAPYSLWTSSESLQQHRFPPFCFYQLAYKQNRNRQKSLVSTIYTASFIFNQLDTILLNSYIYNHLFTRVKLKRILKTLKSRLKCQ